jgi:hypothetical protein
MISLSNLVDLNMPVENGRGGKKFELLFQLQKRVEIIVHKLFL